MEYQKIINLSDNAPNQLTKFRIKKWVKINDDSREIYNTNSQIKFKTLILKPILCDHNESYILESVTITTTGAQLE